MTDTAPPMAVSPDDFAPVRASLCRMCVESTSTFAWPSFAVLVKATPSSTSARACSMSILTANEAPMPRLLPSPPLARGTAMVMLSVVLATFRSTLPPPSVTVVPPPRTTASCVTGARVRARGGELGGVVVIADDVISLVVEKPADVIASARGALTGDRIAGVQHAALAEIDEPVVARRVEHDRIGGEQERSEQTGALEFVACPRGRGCQVDRRAGVRVVL